MKEIYIPTVHSNYREYLHMRLTTHTIRVLAIKLLMFKPYDPVHREIKKDIKKLILTH